MRAGWCGRGAEHGRGGGGPEGIPGNSVCPGNIATERLVSLIEERAKREGMPVERAVEIEEARVPMGFLGEPEDVANLAVFLASAKARSLQGGTLPDERGRP